MTENQISDLAFYSGDKIVPKNKVFKKSCQKFDKLWDIPEEEMTPFAAN